MVRFAPVVGVGRSPPRRSWRSRGRAGRRARRSRRRPSCPRRCSRRTPDVIVRALGALGIAEINQAITAGTFPPLPSPVREDGPGWRAEVDLPYGVTAAHGHRPPRAARLRPAPPARRGVARAGHQRARRAPRAVGRPRGHLQGQAARVAAAALRAGRRVRAAAVRHRRPRPGRQGPDGLPQLADRRDAPAGQDGGRPGAAPAATPWIRCARCGCTS